MKFDPLTMTYSGEDGKRYDALDLRRRATEMIEMGTPKHRSPWLNPNNYPPLTNPEEPTPMPDQMYLYQITIVDSRIENDEAAVEIFNVRSLSVEGARLKALLRGPYDESDLKFVDIFTQKASPVKSIIDGAMEVDDEDDDDE